MLRSIDPLSEECLTLSQAAKRLPHLRGDRPVAPSTVWRWAQSGVRGVKLETVRIGNTMCTSVEALSRFLAAINDQPVQSVHDERHHERVEQELATRGI